MAMAAATSRPTLPTVVSTCARSDNMSRAVDYMPAPQLTDRGPIHEHCRPLRRIVTASNTRSLWKWIELVISCKGFCPPRPGLKCHPTEPWGRRSMRW